MPPRRFRYFMSAAVKQQLRDVFRQAAARGQQAEAVAAFAKIEEGLTWLADEAGESRFPLNVMGELCVITIGPIGALYAVDRDKWEVYIGRFRLMGVRRDKD